LRQTDFIIKSAETKNAHTPFCISVIL